ncbi:MAG TPA: calcium/proton exchanger [Stellaceae bacterium]|nr:calcium/proton exchanger [Stellaceae bacterium]
MPIERRASSRRGGHIISLLLLLTVPVSLALKYLFAAPPLWVFASAVVALAVLADWVKQATEQVAERAGPAIGGLLNVSFGSIAELILALFVLAGGEAAVVRAQITGSIIGTSLLGLGLAILVGGATRERQSFGRQNAGLLSSLLILVVVALLLPAVFDYLSRAGGVGSRRLISEEELSLGASAVLILLYAGNLVYTLVTHRDVFARDEEAGGTARWSLSRSLTVLVLGTVAIAAEADLVSGALAATAERLHLSRLFLGVIVLALVGTSADLFAAVAFARRDRMGLVFNICLGSAIQMALLVAPLLVLLSWLIGQPMDLVFSNPLELFAIAGTAFIVNAIAADGETTWFEGLLLLGVYALFGLGFFFAE